jgi:N-acetylated-alpha-linked acidic dipeptidase
VPPYLNFAPLQNGLDALQRSTDRYGADMQRSRHNGGAALARASLAGVNAKIMQSERAMTLPAGLLNRPWYKHKIYAPGYYTGYGVKTIPGVREAIEQKQWKLADEQIVRAGEVLQNEARVIDEAATALQSATK